MWRISCVLFKVATSFWYKKVGRYVEIPHLYYFPHLRILILQQTKHFQEMFKIPKFYWEWPYLHRPYFFKMCLLFGLLWNEFFGRMDSIWSAGVASLCYHSICISWNGNATILEAGPILQRFWIPPPIILNLFCLSHFPIHAHHGQLVHFGCNIKWFLNNWILRGISCDTQESRGQNSVTGTFLSLHFLKIFSLLKNWNP